MDHIFRVLPRVLQKRGIAEHAQAALVVHRAAEWLRKELPHLSKHARVTRLKDTILTIECSHPIAAQECQGQSALLLSFLQENCPFMKVSEVRVGRERAPAKS